MFKQRKYLILLLLFFLKWSFSYGSLSDVDISKVERFIIDQQKDSVLLVYNQINENELSSYAKLLRNIALSEQIEYHDLYTFINKVIDDKRIREIDIHHYLIEYLTPPKEKNLNIYYVKIKWLQITFLTELVMMEEAEREHSKLSEYIAQFEAKNDDVQRAVFYRNIYPIILNTINRNIEEGEQLYYENQKIANHLKDTNLLIVSNYYRSDLLLARGELEEYIKVCEENISLEHKLKTKTNFYYANLCHLIDALIYKGGQEERILKLLEEVYNKDKYKEYSYSYYIQLLGNLPDSSSFSKHILQKFKVNDIIEFSDFSIKEAKGVIPPNEYYQLLRLVAEALFKKEYYLRANKIHYLSVTQIREIYTKDLADVLATYKIRELEKKKQYELSLANEKSKRFLYSILLLGVIIFITIIGLIILRIKHKKIAKREQEKQLLLQEIHHRVKNNFQIVSSLLKLQVKGIKDEKAIEMAIEGQNRVKSMALIHEKLYQNEDLQVNFEDYINTLISNINVLYNKVSIIKEVDVPSGCNLDIDTAVPLGLILNELITNAFKYAFFEATDTNTLKIICQKNGVNNVLIVSDNGEGIQNKAVFENTESIGLRLVKSLAKQLHGSVEYEYNNGATFKVFYKETVSRQEAV